MREVALVLFVILLGTFLAARLWDLGEAICPRPAGERAFQDALQREKEGP